MLTTRVIPCLDVNAGRVVKGVKFSGLRDAGDPAERASVYEAQGADELVLLDVSATPEGRSNATDTVRRVRQVLGVPLTGGGGVRQVDDARRLFGSQCTVLAIDAARSARGFEVVIRSGKERTGRDAILWAREAAARGAGEILLTSWDRDGTRSGYDTELIQAIASCVNIPIVASGGAAHAGHLIEAVNCGASAVLAASILHDGETTVGDLKRALANAGLPVRL